LETEAKARASGVSLEAEVNGEGISVLGDAIRLKQAVINLVDNAIKYNRPGGSVVLGISRRGDKVVIEVRDTGPGIAAEDVPLIFDRFYRVDKSRSRAAGGSGLGLAIVRKIAEDHGGMVEVESVVGQGSAFRLILPVSP
jgi:signal transduction histidine kinase